MRSKPSTLRPSKASKASKVSSRNEAITFLTLGQEEVQLRECVEAITFLTLGHLPGGSTIAGFVSINVVKPRERTPAETRT